MLADKIVNIWDKIFQMSKWDKIEDVCFSPDTKNQPLINHINVITIVALKMAEQIEMVQKIKFDKDLIITIGLLHGVSKLIKYQPDINNNYKKSEIGGKYNMLF